MTVLAVFVRVCLLSQICRRNTVPRQVSAQGRIDSGAGVTFLHRAAGLVGAPLSPGAIWSTGSRGGGYQNCYLFFFLFFSSSSSSSSSSSLIINFCQQTTFIQDDLLLCMIISYSIHTYNSTTSFSPSWWSLSGIPQRKPRRRPPPLPPSRCFPLLSAR